jgi:flagellar capping protein FliD
MTSRNGGHLEIDEEDLKKAVKTDLEGIKRLFSANGFSDNPGHEMGRFTEDTKTGTYDVDPATDDFDTDSSDASSFSTAKRIGEIMTSENGDSKGLSIRAPIGSGSGQFTFVRGLADQIKQYVDQANDFVDGLFTKTKEGYDKRIDEYDDRILRLEDQVQRFRASLTAQFSSMEQSMQRLQSQNQAFLSQVGSFR